MCTKTYCRDYFRFDDLCEHKYSALTRFPWFAYFHSGRTHVIPNQWETMQRNFAEIDMKRYIFNNMSLSCVRELPRKRMNQSLRLSWRACLTSIPWRHKILRSLIKDHIGHPTIVSRRRMQHSLIAATGVAAGMLGALVGFPARNFWARSPVHKLLCLLASWNALSLLRLGCGWQTSSLLQKWCAKLLMMVSCFSIRRFMRGAFCTEAKSGVWLSSGRMHIAHKGFNLASSGSARNISCTCRTSVHVQTKEESHYQLSCLSPFLPINL